VLLETRAEDLLATMEINAGAPKSFVEIVLGTTVEATAVLLSVMMIEN
jgi:hypothetical protein